MSTQESVDVLVLAGDRNPSDPWLCELGVAGKALIPLGGVALLQRVLDCLAQWPDCGHVILVAPKGEVYQQVVAESLISIDALTWIEPSKRLFASVTSALNLPGRFTGRGLIVSADHGLLRHEWLDDVMRTLGDHGDVSIGMADWAQITQAYPGARRTRYRFSDITLCGGNLFAFRMPAFERVLSVWSRVESARKKPWRMLSMLGPWAVTKYLTGTLESWAAFAILSRITSTRIAPAVITDPAVSVDVDSPNDLLLAEVILHQRSMSVEISDDC